MRKSLVLALALAVLAATAPGQVAGKHRGVFIGVGIYTTVTSAIGVFSASNKFTMYPTGSTAWPYWGNMWHGAQDTDNQSVITYALVGATNPPSRYAFVQWDPIGASVVGTLWSAPFSTRYPANVTNITLNSDGDLVGFDSMLNQLVLYDRFNKRWVGTTLMLNVGINGGLGGFEWDRINGGYYLANSRAPNTAPIQNLVHVSADLKTSSIVATTTNSNIRANMGGALLDNGDWVVSSFTPYRYHMVKAGGSAWSSGPASVGMTTTDVSPEKFAAAKTGYYAALVGGTTVLNQTVAHVDASTSPHTYTNLATPGPLPGSVTGWIMEAMPLYDRDIATRRTGKATWDINIRPDPQGTFAGKTYIVAASLLGARPAIPLPDGREIFLTPDVLTLATILGPFPPFLTGNVGKLDVFGKATAKLDLSALGTAANGNVIHFCGVVIDSAAPGGIGWVFDPCAFVVNVLP